MEGTEKNRVKLNICGAELVIRTEKSEEYAENLAGEIESVLEPMVKAGIPLVKAALLIDISSLDDNRELKNIVAGKNADIAKCREVIEKLKNSESDLSKRNALLSGKNAELAAEIEKLRSSVSEPADTAFSGEEVEKLRKSEQESRLRAEMLLSENSVLDEENSRLREEIEELRAKLAAKPEDAGVPSSEHVSVQAKSGNPMRRKMDETNLTAYYEKSRSLF